jgi:hypothetical protein
LEIWRENQAMKSFDEVLIAYSENETKLNLARHKIFSICNENLFLSKYLDPYEESVENYFLKLNRLFEGGLYDESIKTGINSKDPHLRRLVLQIIKDGFFSDEFLQEIACDLLILSIDGNDNDRILAEKILSRRYDDKSILIELLPGCISRCFSELEVDPEDAYYAYKNS